MRSSQQNRLQVAYVSGPMRGIADFNYPLFNQVSRAWRDAGYVVYNPAENFGGFKSLSLKDYLRLDLQQVLDSHFLIMLPGWEHSEGAKIEKALAEAVDTPVLIPDDPIRPYSETILRAYLRL